MSWWGWCGGVHKIHTQIAQRQIGWTTQRPVIRRLKLSVLLSGVKRFTPQPLKNFIRYVSSYRRKDAVAPAVLVQGFGTPLRDSIAVKENKSQFRLKTSRQKVHATFATVQLWDLDFKSPSLTMEGVGQGRCDCFDAILTEIPVV